MNEILKIFNNTFWLGLSITIIVVSAIWATVSYYGKSNELMSQNIETAVSKGLDPLSVRCSYASSTDNICVAYASKK